MFYSKVFFPSILVLVLSQISLNSKFKLLGLIHKNLVQNWRAKRHLAFRLGTTCRPIISINNETPLTGRYKVETECKISTTLSKNFARAFIPSKSARRVAICKEDKQKFAKVGIFCDIHTARSNLDAELKKLCERKSFAASVLFTDDVEDARSLVCGISGECERCIKF